MFKILILQGLYNLSDDQTEYQIKDRISFMRFLGLQLEDRVPDAKTIWLYREILTKTGAIKKLFKRFDTQLRLQGYLAMGGQIVDATVVQAPRPKMTKEEKAQVKAGETPPEWQDNPAKNAQKDKDGRWTMKRSNAKPDPMTGKAGPEILVPAFGYKNHINTDRTHGLIREFEVTPASAADGPQLAKVIDTNNTASDVWADTAYRSKANETLIEDLGLKSKIHFRKPKGKKMSGPHQRANATRSKVRSKIEHVFGMLKTQMNLTIRTIGKHRAATKIGMANLVYNMRRLAWLEQRPQPESA